MLQQTDAAQRVRTARQESERWRDLLWQSIVDDLGERDSDAAAAARTAASASPVRALHGWSTQGALRAWAHLDVQARLDWIWVCQFVNRIWLRSMQEALTESA